MNYFNINLSFLSDWLTGFFIFVILLISVPSAVYSMPYMKGHYSTKKSMLNWALLIMFVLSMLLVVSVGNTIYFLVSWELMSLLSFFFVVFDYEDTESVKAGVLYIIMTHLGTACIAAAFFLLYKYTGSFDYAVIKSNISYLPAEVKNIIFVLLFAGFGTKAGIVPLHIWLPQAHPQAPGHISSIMSGVMIKTAIYGIIRFAICIFGPGPLWWGYTVMTAAAVSCLVGVIYALMEHDIKRLLAYHSVENIGIILLGVGGAMILKNMGLQFLALLSLIAGLYHLINHAVFKSLLFLCAGSVYRATGTRDMEKMGGLIKAMPWTAASFLAGSLAISAIPPFNGFVSEWLTFQSLFGGALNSAGGSRLFFSLMAAALALTGGLAAACFVKAFGITFLAAPRSTAAGKALEVPPLMKYMTALLSVFALILGLAAVPAIKIIKKAAGMILAIDTAGFNFALNNSVVSVNADKGLYVSNPYFAILFICLAGVIAAALYVFLGRSSVKVGKTWGCGYYNLDSRTEYTATAFAKPFKIALGFFLKPFRKIKKEGDSIYHIKKFEYETHTTHVFNEYGYDILMKFIMSTAKKIRRSQPGSINIYLGYIFITLLVLMLTVNMF
ncbi:MAG: hydrogenase 4 subunit B [Elusimicrobia bacterium]|nr:hydrogenase 4 subunit B [Elusimicrobiota bacterium]